MKKYRKEHNIEIKEYNRRFNMRKEYDFSNMQGKKLEPINKNKIIRKKLSYPCYCCRKSPRGKTANRKTCKACNGTGFFKDDIFYFIYTGKDGKKYCIDSDNLA